MELSDFLISLGVNISSSALYDRLKSLFQKNETIDIHQLKQMLKEISIPESKIDSIVEFLADNGTIEISGAVVTASNIISYSSFFGSSIDINASTISRTNSTLIKTGNGEIKLRGKASIIQKN